MYDAEEVPIGRVELNVAQDEARLFWHAYMAEVPDMAVSDDGVIGPALAFTIIGGSSMPKETAPPTMKGTILGCDLVYHYVTTWDHEPSDEEVDKYRPE